MKLKIVNITLLLLLIISYESFSQWAGYVIWKGNVSREGYVKINKGRSSEVEFYTNPEGEPTIISAEELIEVGYDRRLGYDNRIFNPLDVRSGEGTQKEMAELLVDGELKLYRSLQSKTFFIEGGKKAEGRWIWAPRPAASHNVTQLDEQNVRKEIKGLALRCSRWNEQYALVKMKEGPLKSFVTNYNHRDCKNIQLFNFGLLASYNWSSLSLFRESFSLNRLGDYSIEEQSWSIGAFIESPVWLTSGLSFVSQLYYTKRDFNNQGTRELTVDIENSIYITQEANVKHSSLTFEIGPKYTFNTRNYRPYLFGNGVFEYIFNQESSLFHQIVQPDGSLASRTEYDVIPVTSLQYGLSYGVGLQYFYKIDQYIALEVKNIVVYDTKLTRKIDQMNSTVFSIKVNI